MLSRVAALPDLPGETRGELLRHWVLLGLLTGRPQALPGPLERPQATEAGRRDRALWLAAAGDTTTARSALRGLSEETPTWTARMEGLLGEALVDERTGRFERAAESMAPLARSGYRDGRPLPMFGAYASRWMASEAWRALGRSDSAAVFGRMALERGRISDGLFAQTVTRPFALQRLVLLEARAGRLEAARGHWFALQSRVTAPDAEFRPLMEEARRALAVEERGVEQSRAARR